jgi:hypothetical protein
MRILKVAGGLFVIVAIFALVPVAFTTSPSGGAYESVLSKVLGTTLAESLVCTKTVCNKGGTACNSVTRMKNCKVADPCVTSDC